jgi:DNA-binding MarR family transcriptional regulator
MWETAFAFGGWRRRLEQELQDRFGAALMQFWVLMAVRSHPERSFSIRELASLLELKYTSIADCVGALKRRGAVLKQVDDIDLRLTHVHVTAHGVELYRQWEEALKAAACTAFELLGYERGRRLSYDLYNMVEKFGKAPGSRGEADNAGIFVIACTQLDMEFQRLCTNAVLTQRQAELLLLLHDRHSVRPGDAARLLAKSASDVSKTSSQLGGAHLVRRRVPDGQRREARLELTPSGAARAEDLDAAMRGQLRHDFGDDADEQEFLDSVAHDLAEVLRNDD